MEDHNNPFLDDDTSNGDEDAVSGVLNDKALEDDMEDNSSAHLSSSSDDTWNALLSGTDEDEAIAEKQSKQRRNKRIKNTLMGAGIVVLSIILLIFSIEYIMSLFGNQTAQQPQPQKSVSQSVNSAYTDSNGGRNPASASDISYASVSGNSIVSVDHRKITVKGEKATTVIDLSPLQSDIAPQDCNLKDEASSCYVGLSKYKDKDVDIFAFRDSSKTSLLLTSNNITKQNIQGTVLAYSQPVSVDSKTKHALVLVNSDQTGIMLVSDVDLNTLNNGTLVSSSSNK